MFWKDNWLNHILEHEFPRSYFFVKNKSISVSKAFSFHAVTEMFHLPLSQTAFDQVQTLQQMMQATELSNDEDIWVYTRGATKFSSSTMYKKLIGHHPTDLALKWIWKSHCQPKHTVFAWLLLKDRLSTRNILRRKHMRLETYSCVLCNQGAKETIEHLFLHCPFAQQCWGLINLMVSIDSGVFVNFNAFKNQLQSQFFMEAIILICWTIWIARNELVFNVNQLSLQECKRNFFREVNLVGLRVKSSSSLLFDQ
jgi:hypothetical protein